MFTIKRLKSKCLRSHHSVEKENTLLEPEAKKKGRELLLNKYLNSREKSDILHNFAWLFYNSSFVHFDKNKA